jgi:hypothetical protein
LIEKRIKYASVSINLDSVDYLLNPEEVDEVFKLLDENCGVGKWEVYVENWFAIAQKVPMEKAVWVADKLLEIAFRASKRSTKIIRNGEKEFHELRRNGATDSELFEYVLKFPCYSEAWLNYRSTHLKKE